MICISSRFVFLSVEGQAVLELLVCSATVEHDTYVCYTSCSTGPWDQGTRGLGEPSPGWPVADGGAELAEFGSAVMGCLQGAGLSSCASSPSNLFP